MKNRDLKLTNGKLVLMEATNVDITFVNTNSYEITDSETNEVLLNLIKGNDISLFITPTENENIKSEVFERKTCYSCGYQGIFSETCPQCM